VGGSVGNSGVAVNDGEVEAIAGLGVNTSPEQEMVRTRRMRRRNRFASTNRSKRGAYGYPEALS
jgi:hypothetical protein